MNLSVSNDNSVSSGFSAKRMLLLFGGLLIIGAAGYFNLRGHWAFYLFAHLGALGVVGLLGVAAASIGRIKGHDYVTALGIGVALPIALGVIAVFLVRFLGEKGVFYCGGAVSLAVALLIIVYYSVFRRKPA